MSFLTKIKGDAASLPPRASAQTILFASLGGAMAIAIIALVGISLHVSLLLGSLGASAILLFGFPDVVFSQPRNVILGHTISSAAGLAVASLCGYSWWSVAVSVALAIALMMLLRVVHPPAASNPVIVFLGHPTWSFVLFPTFAGAVVIVLIALVSLNLTRESRWPKYW